MRKPIVLLSLLLTLVTGSATALAQEASAKRGLGLGAETTLAGTRAASLVYDTGKLHVDALLGFLNVGQDPADDTTAFVVGARLFFVLHEGTSSDFSAGGGLMIVNADNLADDSETNFELEGAAQIRAFITPNVALSASLGLAIIIADDYVIGGDDLISGAGAESVILINGQLIGGAGITYFFQ